MTNFSFSEATNFDATCCDLKGRSPREIFSELLSGSGYCSEVRARLVDKLCRREELGSTGLTGGIAMPHANDDVVATLTCFIGVSHDGVDWNATDDQPVRLFLLTVSNGSRQRDYYRAGAYNATCLRRPGFVESLINADSTDEMRQILLTADEEMSSVNLEEAF
ncbi:MAG: PTS sugar transporter subunit IIA [Planctomycetia bacterium]|nr:PTS sugar transporter subunit IIA [Planctomycetia bacterium]